MEWPQELLDLFEDPILAGVKPAPAPLTADDRIQKKIQQVKDWIAANGREPLHESKNITEKLMSVSLQTLKDLGLWT